MSQPKKFIQTKEEKDLANFQANIDPELNNRIRAKLKQKDVQVRQFMEGAIRAYLAGVFE